MGVYPGLYNIILLYLPECNNPPPLITLFFFFLLVSSDILRSDK